VRRRDKGGKEGAGVEGWPVPDALRSSGGPGRPDTAAGGVEGRYTYPVPVLKVPEESEGNVWVRTRCWRKVFILQSGWLR
jgi:hypothetical protein